MSGWLLVLAFIGGAEPMCDMVEINHYEPEGGSGFTQLIAWDWDSRYGRWHAQQWVIIGGEWSRVGSVACVSFESGKWICVRSRLFRETWTSRDPERANLSLFPMEQRRRVW